MVEQGWHYVWDPIEDVVDLGDVDVRAIVVRPFELIVR